MGDKSGIEWTDATWNPTTGCDKVSPGCDHCYALTMAARLKGMGQERYQTDGDPKTSGPGFGFAMHEDALDQPIRWTRPRVIFVNSMSDLFHGGMTYDFLAKVWAVMSVTPRHTYQVLTKRPQIARSIFTGRVSPNDFTSLPFKMLVDAERLAMGYPVLPDSAREDGTYAWPLPNVWLGTSVEDQKRADLRIPALLETPAAHRFLSCEPLLGPVSFRWAKWHPWRDSSHLDGIKGIDWVIVGGESGKGARPMHPEWARTLRDQCAEAGIAFNFKQWGEWAPHRLDGGEHTNVRLSKTRDQYESHRFTTDGTAYNAFEPDGYSLPTMTSMLRVGKRKAGRNLDGRTHDDVPGRTDLEEQPA